jgi:hypothetical protein
MKCRWSAHSANSEIPRPVVPNRDFRTHTSLGTQRSPLRSGLTSWHWSRGLHIIARMRVQGGLTRRRREPVGEIPVMEQPDDRIDRLEVLRGLVERLCGADLTLAEAKSLRIQVLILLDRDELSAETDSSTSSLSAAATAWTRRDGYSRDFVVEESRSLEDC